MRNEKNEEDLKKQADTIYLTSILMGQIVIWLLISLLVYAGVRLSVQSFSSDIIKILIIFLIIGGLIVLSVFMIKKGKKRVNEIRRQ